MHPPFTLHPCRYLVGALLCLLAPLVAPGQPPDNDYFTNRIPMTVGARLSTNADTTFSVALTDLNNDGKLDVVVGNQNQRSRFFLNNGTPAPFAGVLAKDLTTNATPLWSIAAGDVTGDSYPDVVVGNIGQALRLYTNNGTADPFTNTVGKNITSDANSTFALALTDIRFFGGLDVLAANGGASAQFSRFYTNNLTGDPFTGITGVNVATAVHNTKALVVGDVNNDGYPDVVFGNNGANSLLFTNNRTANPFNGVASQAIATGALDMRAAVIGDINRDNRPDLIFAGRGHTIRLYTNNGTASPFNGVTGRDVSPDTNQTTSLALKDVNGDDWLDLVAGNENQTIRLYLNDNDFLNFNGFIGSDVSLESLPTISVALGDLNGDDLPDLVAGNLGRTNRVYFNNGTGSPFDPFRYFVEADSDDATNEQGEPNHAGIVGGRSLWWTWTPATNGIVTLEVNYSSFGGFRRMLAVYTGSSLSNLVPVTANFDNHAFAGSALVSFVATAGTAYQIAVDDLNGAGGEFDLRLRPSEPMVPSITSNPAPQLTTIGGLFSMSVAVTGTAPFMYQWKRGNTLLSGATNSLLTISNAQNLDAGDYTVIITNVGGSVTSAIAPVIVLPVALNDHFTNRINLAGASPAISGHNVNTTLEPPQEPVHNNGSDLIHSVWWTWTAPTNGLATVFVTSTNLPVLTDVYRGTSLTGLVNVGSADWEIDGRTSFATTAGSNYVFAATGNESVLGGFVQPVAIRATNLNTAPGPSGFRLFDAQIQIGNSSHGMPGPLRLTVLARSGWSATQPYINNGSPPDQLLGTYYLANPATVAPGTTTNLLISGACPGPTVVVPENYGYGWWVYVLLEEQLGTNWFLRDKMFLCYGNWPTIGGYNGPGGSVIMIAPNVSGAGFNPPSLTNVTVSGPNGLNEGTSASYYGTAFFDKGGPVNFTNTVWTASAGTISTNGLFQSGIVSNDLPVTLSAYYVYSDTNLASKLVIVSNRPPPAWTQATISLKTNLNLQLQGVPQRKHRIEATETLTNGAVWLPLLTNQLGASGLTNFTLPINPNQPRRFFRPRELD